MANSPLPLESIRHLVGFGMAQCADGYVVCPASEEDISRAFHLAEGAGRQVTLRGASRSYGDAALGTECVVIDLSGFNGILSFDAVTGVVEARPGATLEQIWRLTLPTGWWLPVVSGTMKTSLGGALAMNIHGKNNFRRGPLGEHVVELDLLTPCGERKTLKQEDDLFRAVIGGLGLLGVITRIKLQMKKVSSGDVKVEACSCRNWEEQFAAFERFEGNHEYVVSWIDCLASGDAAGRGILHASDHVDEPSPAPSLRLEHQHLPSKVAGFVPKSSVWRILRLFNNRPGMRFVNSVKHFAGKTLEHGKVRKQSLSAFNFLLDYVPGWEKAYLPGGLIQCQFFVPKNRARQVFTRLLEMQQAEKLESYLAVMKRHRPDRFLLSHAVDGYSLAMDFKVAAKNRGRLWDLAFRMNQFALENGGRFYFAKDSTLTSEQAASFLGESLVQFREIKRVLDPNGLLSSDLARRLNLA